MQTEVQGGRYKGGKKTKGKGTRALVPEECRGKRENAQRSQKSGKKGR